MGQATIRTKKFKGKQVDPQQSVYDVREGKTRNERKIGGRYSLPYAGLGNKK